MSVNILLKEPYATNKIKDEIEWGVHIRETRKQGEQIQLTEQKKETPPVVEYRKIKSHRRRRRRKRTAIPASPEKPQINRETCTKKEYLNMLATPRVYVMPPEAPGMNVVPKPCPPRFVQLAVPKKKHIFNTWQDYENTLPASKIVGLKQLLEKEEALKPTEAARYFKELKKKKKQKRKEKFKKETQVTVSKPRKTRLLKELNKLVDSIFSYLMKKSATNIKFKHMMITEIIKRKLQENKLIKPYKRSDTKNINAKTLHEVLDQLAIWLDSNIDIEDEESEAGDTEKLSEGSTVSSITYINLLLSISDELESKVSEAEEASVATVHEIEEVLEDMYRLSDTEMVAEWEEEISMEREPQFTAVDEVAKASEEEQLQRDSGIFSDISVLTEEDEGFVEDDVTGFDLYAEEMIEGYILHEEMRAPQDELEEVILEEVEEAEPQFEEAIEEVPHEVEEIPPEVEEVPREVEEVPGEVEEVPREVEEVPREVEEVPREVEEVPHEVEEVPPEVEEIPGEVEDIEKMQRDFLDDFYEQQLKHLLVSKEELGEAEGLPSLVLPESLLEITRLESITVEQHAPDAICCVSMKSWLTWLLDVAENSQSWCKWMQITISRLRYYAAVLKGEVKTNDGKMKTLSKEEWSAFVEGVEKDIVSWRQYNMHVQDLSEDIIKNFADKRVICCPECLKSKMILSEECAQAVSGHLVEAVKTSAYWKRWLDAVLMETEKITQLDMEMFTTPSLEEAGTSATVSVYELIEMKCTQKKRESSESVFIIEEMENK